MELLVGPTLAIDVPSPPGYVVPQKDKPPSLFSEEEADRRPEKVLIAMGIGSGTTEDSSESSSSIGAPDDSEVEEDDSVVSSSKEGLGSMETLDDSLPIKRGLSNHFSGKSKSFADLSYVNSVASAKDLEKPENPFNKRRRILMANKWSRKSSFYSWHNPKSMPLLALNEDEQEDGDVDGDDESPASSSPRQSHQERQDKLFMSPKLQGKKFNTVSLKSQSCFSLTDLGGLQHHR
uniref:Uncharacterized protein n=2 Tax=Rhizophora mucronata TaxID=61149 RepID=A0A2P2J960_RHIMU